MRIVDFIICGTQKGGTSALSAYLRKHPEICMSDKKELHFFDNEANFTGTPDYSAYHSSFNPQPSHKILGEATPRYMYWEAVPRRIWEYNPLMKLIVLLRNPIERAFSQWNMNRHKGIEVLPFWDALQTESERCRERLPFQHRQLSYTDRGFYLEQLRRLWRFFPKDQILIMKSERFKEHPQEVLNEVCDFLGVCRIGNVRPSERNTTPYESSMSDRERTYLRQIFEHEILALEKILGWDCSGWLSG